MPQNLSSASVVIGLLRVSWGYNTKQPMILFEKIYRREQIYHIFKTLSDSIKVPLKQGTSGRKTLTDTKGYVH